MDTTKLAITIGVSIFLWVFRNVIASAFHYTTLVIDGLSVENPYPRDHERSFPKKVRFLRLSIRSRIGRLREVQAELKIKNSENEYLDNTGILHWQRQPRAGKPHPLKMHEDLTTAEDVKDHMYDYHFSENKPVDIPSGECDKVDLFMKIEDLPYAISTVSRESHIDPGNYEIEVKVTASNVLKPKKKLFKVKFGEVFDDIQIL
ncbi:hypothetical protein [Candidatus Thiodiazotropha sp. CDECU1]|uniref:hypothetical protein n=1 Tax=Candidatus Thiodiazotropha sp. CDECU1 TaxID=3065865 RepID=UPI0029304261|nr:hypothetical protein [Candidatus Thiodiazotropha sp. CDECU1]